MAGPVALTARPPPEVAQAEAGGKVLLLGEHAVVYGSGALAAELGVGVRAVASALAPGARSRLQMLGRRIVADAASADPVECAWAALCDAAPAPPVDAAIEGELPAGVGLGFSAAVGVALGRAVEQLGGAPVDATRVRARAMAWERVFHGNPSGVDVEAVMADGVIHFAKAQGARPVRCADPIVLCVGLSGTAGSTSAMVASVASRRRRERSAVDEIVTAIDRRVALAERAMEQGDAPRLGALLDEGQELLVRLGVSTPALDRLCALARASGALGAKLTGSGGGGAVIALAGIDGNDGGAGLAAARAAVRIVSSWREAGFEAFETVVGGPRRQG